MTVRAVSTPPRRSQMKSQAARCGFPQTVGVRPDRARSTVEVVPACNFILYFGIWGERYRRDDDVRIRARVSEILVGGDEGDGRVLQVVDRLHDLRVADVRVHRRDHGERTARDVHVEHVGVLVKRRLIPYLCENILTFYRVFQNLVLKF